MKRVFNQIDWFRERGFLLGRDKPRDIYYVVDSGTGRRYNFNSLQMAQEFVEGVETERELNYQKTTSENSEGLRSNSKT